MSIMCRPSPQTGAGSKAKTVPLAPGVRASRISAPTEAGTKSDGMVMVSARSSPADMVM